MLAAVFIASLAPTLATSQDFVGRFEGLRTISTRGGSSQLSFRMELGADRTATLTVEQTPRREIGNSDINRYGFIIRDLYRDLSVQVLGRWEREGSVAYVRFERVRAAGETRREESFIRFRLDGSTLRSTEMYEGYFGREPLGLERKYTDSGSGRPDMAPEPARKYGGNNYAAKVDVRDLGPVGSLEYRLFLDSGGRARMELKQTGRFDLDRYAFESYGDDLKWLEDSRSIELSGSYSERYDAVDVDFNQVRYSGRTDYRDVSMRLIGRGPDLALESWDTRFFGRNPRPTFKRQSRDNNNLLVGLAVLAAGALIVGSSHQTDELSYNTGGQGTFSFGNGDRYRVDGAKFNLRNGGSAEIELRSSSPFKIGGRWTRRNDDYSISIEWISLGSRRYDASGRAFLETRNGRKEVRSLDLDVRTSGYLRDGQLYFTAARG